MNRKEVIFYNVVLVGQFEEVADGEDRCVTALRKGN